MIQKKFIHFSWIDDRAILFPLRPSSTRKAWLILWFFILLLHCSPLASLLESWTFLERKIWGAINSTFIYSYFVWKSVIEKEIFVVGIFCRVRNAIIWCETLNDLKWSVRDSYMKGSCFDSFACFKFSFTKCKVNLQQHLKSNLNL